MEARSLGPRLTFDSPRLVAGCQGALQRAAVRPRLAPVLVASRAGKAADVPLAAEPDSPAARESPASTSTSNPGSGLGAPESPHEHELAPAGSRGPSLSPASNPKRPGSSARAGPSGSGGASPNGAGPGGPGGPGGSSPPGGGADGLRLRYWLVLLVQYGGLYGTAAVVLSAITGVPAFGPGGVRWDAADVGVGLALMAPALAMDALVGLPDWSTRREEDAKQLVRLFVDPEALAAERKARQGAKGSAGANGAGAGDSANGTAAPLASTSSSSSAAAAEDSTAAAVGEAARLLASAAVAAELSSEAEAEAERADSGAGASTSGSNGSSGGGKNTSDNSGSIDSAASPAPLWAALQRLRMALELMQETSVRNNPGARLTPLQELAVICVAVTADEMLYRAVLLTLVGRWLRDRFYEAGADDTLLLSLGGLGGGGGVEVDTGVAALWAALFLGCAAGAGVFVGRAWQEATLASRLQAVQAAQREALEQQLKRQRLGTHMTPEEVRQRQEQQARLEALQTNFASSVGVQGALVWLLEGTREVYQVAAAGGAFILTGNLAAPLAGGLAAQCLMSAYQRLGLRRSMERRAEVMRRRKAAAKEREVHRLRQEAAAKELAAEAQKEKEKEEAQKAGAEAQGGLRAPGEKESPEGGQQRRERERELEGAAPAREERSGHKSNEA